MQELEIGQLYSNEEIFRSLKVSNAGGIRLSLQDKIVLRAVIMTSVQGLHGAGENPYHDRLEGDILTFTAAGKLGQQTLAGVNNRFSWTETLEIPGAARIPSPLSGHSTRRGWKGSQSLAFRIQDS
jgi:hypothetical protein